MKPSAYIESQKITDDAVRKNSGVDVCGEQTSHGGDVCTMEEETNKETR